MEVFIDNNGSACGNRGYCFIRSRTACFSTSFTRSPLASNATSSCCSNSGIQENRSDAESFSPYFKAKIGSCSGERCTYDHLFDQSSQKDCGCCSVLLLACERVDIIEDNHVVVPSWLQIVSRPLASPFSNISIALLPMISAPSSKYRQLLLSLEFVSFSSLKNWSEVDSVTASDHIASSSDIENKNMKWPSNLSQKLIEKMSPALLAGEHVCLNNLVMIEALDYNLVFKVRSISVENEYTTSSTATTSSTSSSSDSCDGKKVNEVEIVTNDQAVFIIRSMDTFISLNVLNGSSEKNRSHLKVKLRGENNNDFDNLGLETDISAATTAIISTDRMLNLIRKGYISKFFDRLRDAIRHFFSVAYSPPLHVQSLLISGAEGAGKTEIMKSLYAIIRDFSNVAGHNTGIDGLLGREVDDNISNNSSSSNRSRNSRRSDFNSEFELFILPLELSAINDSMQDKEKIDAEKDDTGPGIDDADVDPSIMTRFRAICDESLRDTGRNFVIVITLDGIDDIFDAHSEIVKEYASATDFNHALKVSFALARLVDAIHNNNSSRSNSSNISNSEDSAGAATAQTPRNVKFLVISTCRVSKALIPVSGAQLPVFDVTLELPRLSFKDRALLFETLLSKDKSNLEIIVGDSYGRKDPQRGNNDINTGNNGNNDNSSSGVSGSSIENDNLGLWSQLAAQITAGCRPGDICRMVSYSHDLHGGYRNMSGRRRCGEGGGGGEGGRKSRRDGGEIGLERSSGDDDAIDGRGGDSGGRCNKYENDVSSKDIIKWKVMAKAIALTPPRMLSRLQNLQIGAELQSYKERLSWRDFCGFYQVKNRLSDLLGRLGSEKTVKLAERFKLPGSGRGFVITGPSGCGKTFLANIMASEIGMNIITVNSTEILSKYFGETETSLRTLFKAARESAPCLLFFDEFDAISCKRSIDNSDTSSGNLNARVLSTFLNELDGVSSDTSRSVSSSSTESSVVVVVACEHIGSLDDALVRPGRLSHHIELYKPDLVSIKEILCHKLNIIQNSSSNSNSSSSGSSGGIPCAEDVDIDGLATYMHENQQASCADVIGLINAAAYNAIRRHVEQQSVYDAKCTAIAVKMGGDGNGGGGGGDDDGGDKSSFDKQESSGPSVHLAAICWVDFLEAMSDKDKNKIAP